MTLTVMVPPAFLALTTTPSMAPSLADDTCPARAAGASAFAASVAAKQNAARAAAVKVDKRVRMGPPRGESVERFAVQFPKFRLTEYPRPRASRSGISQYGGQAKRAHHCLSRRGGHGAKTRLCPPYGR